jgi:hypothetical protein
MNNQETFGTQDTGRRLSRHQCLLFNACTKPGKGVVVNITARGIGILQLSLLDFITYLVQIQAFLYDQYDRK